MSKIKINNLEFSYKDTKVFSGLNFTLKKGKSLSIIGGTGSGKTTLLKILDGKLEYDGEVFVNGLLIEPGNEVLKNIHVIYRDYSFITDTVKKEIMYYTKKCRVDYFKLVDSLNDYFNFNKLLRKKIIDLSKEEEVLIQIICNVIGKPMYLGIDDLLSYLSLRLKVLVLNYLEENNVILVNVTSNMEDVLYTDYLLCLYNGISAIDGKVLDVLNNEQLLKRIGFSLPFLFDLSIQLKAYGMINKVYLSNELLVSKLWK